MAAIPHPADYELWGYAACVYSNGAWFDLPWRARYLDCFQRSLFFVGFAQQCYRIQRSGIPYATSNSQRNAPVRNDLDDICDFEFFAKPDEFAVCTCKLAIPHCIGLWNFDCLYPVRLATSFALECRRESAVSGNSMNRFSLQAAVCQVRAMVLMLDD